VRQPAEWQAQESVWLAWPHRREDWPGKFAPIPWVFVEIIRAVTSHGETVSLVVSSRKVERDARERLDQAGVNMEGLRFYRWPTDRGWMRDCGPQFVERTSDAGERSLVVLDWRFNAWAKYPEHANDDRLPKRIARALEIERRKPTRKTLSGSTRIVLEGGAIDTDGQGTLITTEECLLSDAIQQRNPGLDRAGYEQAFEQWLGIRRVIWLGRGIEGDDTHGHVDDVTRFVAPGRVVTAIEPRVSDANHQPLAENLVRLRAARDAADMPLEIIELPMPQMLGFRGERLPASYANFLITNGSVLVPTFNDPADRIALGVLADSFPNREVIGIHAVDLVWGLGTIHCLTKEQPLVS
jgi:agmatine deiminase